MVKKNKFDAEISALSASATDCQSVHIDWQEERGEDSEGWRSFETSECSECGKVLVLDAGQGEEQHRHLADFGDGETCIGNVSMVEGPMMNYWYPVEISDCAEAARKIADLPLCVVEFRDGSTGLALTGGGMDLSWQICEAFIRIGELPPVAFSRLPAMASLKLDKRHRLIVAACIKSSEIQIRQAERNIEEINRTVATLRKDARQRGKGK